MKLSPKKIIGRIERVDLPLWDISDIEAKIDTGAFTSSVHCNKIEEIIINGQPYVHFNLLDSKHPSYNDQIIELPIHDKRDVKSSNGYSSLRIFIQTEIRIFDQNYIIQLSLTNRSEMKFPLLIGRKFLKKRFVVDVSEKNLSQKHKRK